MGQNSKNFSVIVTWSKSNKEGVCVRELAGQISTNTHIVTSALRVTGVTETDMLRLRRLNNFIKFRMGFMSLTGY